jgi:RNA polymerase sigma factor for flagellar operon FliA
MGWMPRTIRQRQRMIDDAIKSIEARTGHSATDEDIAEELNISSDEFLKWQSQLNVTNVVSLNEFVEAGNEPVMEAEHNSHFIQPEDNITKQELSEKLKEALDKLTEKEKQVILLYYYEDMTLKEISATLEVSESRVSQLHTKALTKMRNVLGEYMGILTG